MQTLSQGWQLEETPVAKWYLRFFPSLADLAFLLPILVLFAKMGGTKLLFADGDTGWHIRTGEWILAHHQVPKTDLFSFTKPNEPWFAWEWAWDLIFALVHRIGGLSGIGFVTAALIGLIMLLAYRLSVKISGNHLMSMAVTALTAAVSSIHWLARPHLFTWLFVLLFLDVLEAARRGTRKAQWRLPLLMMFWVNLHGGFVAGLILVGVYALGEFLTVLATEKSQPAIHAVREALRISAPSWVNLTWCIAATFVNPYGWELHRHVFVYLTDSELLDRIQEFQSISFHAGPALFFEIMLLLAAFVVYRHVKNLQFGPALLLCAWAHLALVSARHIPIFMLVAAPFGAELLVAVMESCRKQPVLAGGAEVLAEMSAELRVIEIEPRFHLITAVALLVMAALFGLGREPFAPEFNPENFPSSALATLTAHAGSRVFTTDQWADYLLYHLYPKQKVFFDGRSDFYGRDFVKVNQKIASAEHDWNELLHDYQIGLVVMKPETPLAAALKLTAGSKILFDDGKVIIFDTSRICQTGLGHHTAAHADMGNPSFAVRALPAAPNVNNQTTLQKGTTS